MLSPTVLNRYSHPSMRRSKGTSSLHMSVHCILYAACPNQSGRNTRCICFSERPFLQAGHFFWALTASFRHRSQ